jgi:hypothetical protein
MDCNKGEIDGRAETARPSIPTRLACSEAEEENKKRGGQIRPLGSDRRRWGVWTMTPPPLLSRWPQGRHLYTHRGAMYPDE